MKVTGSLASINQKQGRSAKGPWTLYRIAIDKGDGSDWEWYGFGFDKPEASEGSVVSFEAEEGKGGMQVKKGTFKLESKTSPAAKSFTSANDTKQDSIVRQNATSTAVAILNGMIAADCIGKLPAANKRYDWYLAQLDELTNRLFLANREPLSADEVRELVGEDPEETAVDETADDDDWEAV